jgi:hypothetical protein
VWNSLLSTKPKSMAGRLPNPIMLTLVVGEEDGMPECPAAKEKLHTYIHTYIHVISPQPFFQNFIFMQRVKTWNFLN